MLTAAAMAAGIMLVPLVTVAPSASASLKCSSSNNGFFYNEYTDQVDHWYSAGGYFTGPLNGQQTLCATFPFGGSSPFQYVIVGGTASGDCLAFVPPSQGGQGDGIVARGCVSGQANETWYNDPQTTGDDWRNGSDSKCLNVGTTPGDIWGVATCAATDPEAMVWQPTP
jgi:hypothetical protein